MKIFVFSLIIPLITFFFGISVYRHSTPRVSLEKISENTDFYDGMDVEIETFLQKDLTGDNAWQLGQPYEKVEYWTFLKFDQNKINFDSLKNELSQNLSNDKFKRVKVIVKGKINDNCGNSPECFSKSLTFEADEIRQISEVETFSRN